MFYIREIVDRAWRAAREWGSTPEERAATLPCDTVASPAANLVVNRAVDVDAAPPILFRWLCQMRVAPYSYDLIDNFGRRSPRELTPGLGNLRVGQRFMTIFRLASFEPDRHLTLVTSSGNTAVTYLVTPRTGGGSRLLVRIRMRSRAGDAMAFLDLPMMRKQLLTLKELAESSAGAAAAAPATAPSRRAPGANAAGRPPPGSRAPWARSRG
jgi:hypothetical protein